MAQRGARDVVDLHHDTVDLVAEVVAVLLPPGAEGQHLVEAVHQVDLGIDRKPGPPQPAEGVRLTSGQIGGRVGWIARRLGTHLPHLVGPEREGAGGGNAGVLLAQRAGGRVPGVDEQLLAGFGLAPVEVGEGGDGHIDLTPHLEHLGDGSDDGVEALGDGGDGGDVGGHVLAGRAVTPRGGLHEPPVPVEQRDGQAVDLQLALEGGVLRHLFGHPVGPGPQLFRAESIVQAHHRHVVVDGRKQRRRRRPDLGGR
jgi:hypothetical protein